MDPTSIIGYTSDKNVAGYSSNDFIWNTVKDTSIDSTCATISRPASCDDDNITACYKQSYCDNKAKGQSIIDLQSVHTGADGRFSDTKNKYNMQLLTTINLGVGIIGIGVFIFYNH